MEGDLINHRADTLRQVVDILPVIVADFQSQDGVGGERRNFVGGSADQFGAELVAAGLVSGLADGVGIGQDLLESTHNVGGHLDLQGVVAGLGNAVHLGKDGLESLFLGGGNVPGDVRSGDGVSGAVGNALVDLNVVGEAVVVGGPALGDPGLQLLVGVNDSQALAHQVHKRRIAIALLTEGGQAVQGLAVADVQNTVAAAGGCRDRTGAGAGAAGLTGSGTGRGVVAAAGGHEHCCANAHACDLQCMLFGLLLHYPCLL